MSAACHPPQVGAETRMQGGDLLETGVGGTNVMWRIGRLHRHEGVSYIMAAHLRRGWERLGDRRPSCRNSFPVV